MNKRIEHFVELLWQVERKIEDQEKENRGDGAPGTTGREQRDKWNRLDKRKTLGEDGTCKRKL